MKSVLGGVVACLLFACRPIAFQRTGANAGQEVTATFQLRASRDTAWMEAFVPAGVGRARAVVVFVNRDDYDRYMYDDRDWRAMCARSRCALLRLGLPNRDQAPPDSQRVRNAAYGGDSALFTALRIAGDRTGHPELREVGVLFFGLSASGNFGLTFSGIHPDRTIGFIRYHSHLRGLRVDTTTLATIPSLTIVGANDAPEMTQDSRALWQAFRARGAPAAYVSHIGQPHVSIDGLVEAGRAMRPWVESIIDQRTSLDSPALRSVQIDRGWWLVDSTAAVNASTTLGRRPSEASWLPNGTTALAVRQLKGMCASIDLRDATRFLGPGTRLVAEDPFACHYATASPQRDLWLSGNAHASETAAASWLAQGPQAAPLTELGSAAKIFVSTRTSCSTVGAVKLSWTFFVSACGDSFGTVTDSARLRPLAKKLIGEPPPE